MRSFRDLKKADWLLDAVLKIHLGHEESDAKLTYLLILGATFLSSVNKPKYCVPEGVTLITQNYLLVQNQNCDIFRSDFRDLLRLTQSTPLSLSVRKGRLIRVQ